MQDTVIDAPRGGQPEAAGRNLPGRVRGFVGDHPYGVVVIVATLARVLFALVSFAVNDTALVPDETQYIDLAAAVADGRGADSWYPGYGAALFRSTWPFCAPLTLLVKVFGPSRLVGQLLAAAFGVATAALTVRLGREVLAKRWAVIAGLVVALLPSQVLWSAVVLRESMIWAALAAIAVCLVLAARARNGIGFAASIAGVVVLVVALVFLRSQTAVVAGWSAVAAALLLPGWRRVLAGGSLMAVAVLAPALYGIGPGGWRLIHDTSRSLGSTRTYLGVDASTALEDRTPYHGSEQDTVCAARPDHTTTTLPGASAIAGAGSRAIRQDDGTLVRVACSGGKPYVVDESLGGTLSFIPRGISATLLRPYPWEHASTGAARAAGMESIAWYAMYVAAVVGLVRMRRTLRALVFPLLFSVGLVGVSVLTQGNVGTAFRHRAQVLWVIVILVASGVEHLVDRRQNPARA